MNTTTELRPEVSARPWIMEPSGGSVFRAFGYFTLDPSGAEHTIRTLLQPSALIVSTVLLTAMPCAAAPAATRVRPPIASRIQPFVGGTSTPQATVPQAVTAGDQVKLVQSALSMTVSDVAAVVGVSRPTIYSWIRGDVAVPQDDSTANRLRSLYDLAAAWQSRTATPVGRLLRVPVDREGSLLDLLSHSTWDRSAINDALQAIETRLASSAETTESAEELAEKARLEDVAVQRGQIRASLRRARGYRR